MHPAAQQGSTTASDLSRRAAALFETVWTRSDNGRHAEAMQAAEEVLALCRGAGDRPCEADALDAVGQLHYRMGRVGPAREWTERALALSKEIDAPGLHGRLLGFMGWIDWSVGDSVSALQKYEQALPYHKQAGDIASEGWTRNSMGLALMSLGDHERALELLEQALALRRAAGREGRAAQTLANLGWAYWNIGDYQRALDTSREGAALAKADNDRESHAWALDGMGIAYVSLGEPGEAMASHRDALALRRAMNDRAGVGQTLINLGWAEFVLGRRADSRRHFNEALEVSRALGDPRRESQALNNLGLIAFVEGEHAAAVEHLDAALHLRRKVGDRRAEAQTLANLGRTLTKLGRHDEAEASIRTARELYRGAGDRGGETSAVLGLAVHFSERDRLNEARTHAEEALAMAESLRTRITRPDLRMSYSAARQTYYELYIDVLMRLHRRDAGAGYQTLALETSERARARSLLEALRESGADIREGIEPALAGRERDVRRRLDAAERSRIVLLARKHTPEEAAAADRDVADRLQQYRDVQADIRRQSPRYAAITQPQPLSLLEIQSTLLDRETLLLEYQLGEDRSYVWAVDATSVRAYTLPPRSTIEAAGRRVYDLMTQSHRRLAKTQTEVAIAGLSATVLGPVAAHLGRRRVVVVSDGILHYIPFGALVDPSGRSGGCDAGVKYCPLVVSREVINLPSVSVLSVIRAESAGRRRPSKTLAMFSDAVFDASDPRVTSAAVRPASGFDRLPHSRREADAILALAPANATLRALDFAADRRTLMSPALKDYRFLHVATHGIVNSARPELSGLVLSLVDSRGRPQDGFLRAHDLYNLSLGADLVVLSACRSALGKAVNGEGLVGLVRGFMYAGSPRVVASLWDVRDAATAQLMEQFYRGMLVERLTPAAALRAAQVAMLRGGIYDAPFYWAGFTLQGDWR